MKRENISHRIDKRIVMSAILFVVLIMSAACSGGPYKDDTAHANPALTVVTNTDVREVTSAEKSVSAAEKEEAAYTVPTFDEDQSSQSAGSAAEVKTEPAEEPTVPEESLSAEPTAEPAAEPTPEPTATPMPTATPTPAPTVVPAGTVLPSKSVEGLGTPVFDGTVPERYAKMKEWFIANAGYYDSLDSSCPQTWCMKRNKDHEPTVCYENFDISKYNAIGVEKNRPADDKVIYLTFDCGYGSTITASLLDTLAAHNAVANFFVTKMYMEACPELTIRMTEEGHTVCNHTCHHNNLNTRDMSYICDEILGCSEYYYNLTGKEMAPFFRFPEGAYSKRSLTILSDLGYKSIFWSIAYVDYNPASQPEPGYVTDHFATYHHNGCIALMHNDSTSNANELDAVLTLLEAAGYRFASLYELD